MPLPQVDPALHSETHFEATDTVRDMVIGLSDGLTVPFALAAGLSGALANAHLVVLAGLAEIAAGSIAMGLGGFLAAVATPTTFVPSGAVNRLKSSLARRTKPKRFTRFSLNIKCLARLLPPFSMPCRPTPPLMSTS